MALTLLREARMREKVIEAGSANGMLGLIAYWHGDFVEARTLCERALDARHPYPDPKARDSFGETQYLRGVFPRRDHVAIGGTRTRTRVDRLGNATRL